jgi:hypothetical protein
VFLRCGRTIRHISSGEFKEKAPDIHNRAETAAV